MRALKNMLELGHLSARTGLASHHGRLMNIELPAPVNHDAPLWMPPILQTVASEQRGIDELVAAIDAHRAFLNDSDVRAPIERRQIEIELSERLRDHVIKQMMKDMPREQWDAIIQQVQTRALAPQSAVQAILGAAKRDG